MSKDLHEGLIYLITAVSRLNVALVAVVEGQFLGGVAEAQAISELLTKAVTKVDTAAQRMK